MDNLGMMEITEIRFLNQSLDRLRTLSTVKNEQDEDDRRESTGDFRSADDAWDG
jgi:hypothetical protein